MLRIPILCYHNIGDRHKEHADAGLYTSTRLFEQQLSYFKSAGYAGVTVSEALSALRANLGKKLFAITFDDGYLDNLELALPILKRIGFRATCYFVSNTFRDATAMSDRLGIRAPATMTLDDARSWLAAGMEVGSHTCRHVRLDVLDERTASAEIERSRKDLEDQLSTAVSSFCYPFGKFSTDTVRLVREAGYSSAVTLRRGFATHLHGHLELPRVYVSNLNSLSQFKWRIRLRYDDFRAALQ